MAPVVYRRLTALFVVNEAKHRLLLVHGRRLQTLWRATPHDFAHGLLNHFVCECSNLFDRHLDNIARLEKNRGLTEYTYSGRSAGKDDIPSF